MIVEGKKIIITGANGCLGKQLVNYFSQNNEIIAIARQSTPDNDILKKCTYCQSDINDLSQQLEADIIIHAAALSDDKGKWKDFYRENVLGTANVVRISKNIPTFIFISSSSVYLPSSKLILEKDSETNGTKGLSNYGKSKWLAEKELMKNTKYQRYFVLRTRALYGVGDTKIIPRIFRLVKNNKLIIPGKMDIKVSMTHFDNLIHGIECCINSSLQGKHIYNLADDETYILIDVVRKIVHGKFMDSIHEKSIPKWLLRLFSTFYIAGMSPLLVRSLTNDMELDLKKIKSEIGYQPKLNLKESIVSINEWTKNQNFTET